MPEKQSYEELELQGMKLKETNIALKVLLKQHGKGRYPGPEGPALVSPWKGVVISQHKVTKVR